MGCIHGSRLIIPLATMSVPARMVTYALDLRPACIDLRWSDSVFHGMVVEELWKASPFDVLSPPLIASSRPSVSSQTVRRTLPKPGLRQPSITHFPYAHPLHRSLVAKGVRFDVAALACSAARPRRL